MRLPFTLMHTAPIRAQATLRNTLKARLSEKQLSRFLKVRERLRERGG